MFDSVVEGSFETREDGSVLFYPHGSWSGYAYRIVDPERQERVRSSIKRFLVVGSVGGGAFGGVLPSYLTPLQFLGFVLALGVAAFLARKVLIQRLVGDCETVETTISFTEQLRRQADAMGKVTTWLLFGVSLMFFLSMLFMGWTSVSSEPGSIERGWIVLGLLVFGGATLISAAQLYLKSPSAG